MVSIVVVPSSTAEHTRQAAGGRSQIADRRWFTLGSVSSYGTVRLGTTRCSTRGYRSTGNGVRQAGRQGRACMPSDYVRVPQARSIGKRGERARKVR